MTKFFMRGTPLAGLEKQMMTPPNFTPRGGGRMILNRFRYRPEDVVCKNCTQCIHGKCSATICPWIEERAEAGVISYSSLAWEYYRNLWGTSLGDRITQLLPGRESITYYNEAHALRFSTYYPYLIHHRDDCTEHRQLAALYLLTATEALRRQALPRVFTLWPVAGDYWKTPRKLTDQEYVLYQAAKGLYLNQPRVRISELADRELVDDTSLSMILDAVLLVHYGKTVLIASVFKVMQELLAPAPGGKNQFQLLMNLLPGEHKAKWLAGAALTAADQAMSSVISTVLSRLNAFLDSEIEQLLCFDSAINAEEFVKNKSAIFLILPEEDPVKNFIAALMIQNLSRELFAVADEHGGKLPNRAIMYCDEFGTMPPFDVLPLFSAGRSRRLTLVPIIQSLAQLEKNYGREGAEILVDNCQDTIFGGFAPQSQTAEKLSQSLGKRTVLSGYVSKGQGGASMTSQMIERPLMTPDELKSMPKGNFIIMKTGTHPAKTRLKLFLEWGITFKEPYSVPEQSKRKIYYASRKELELAIRDKFSSQKSAQVNDAEQEILKKEKKQ